MYFCSAARNSPACKGKSLQCLRKCRFSYIDTSPALSAQRHLRAALRYSACPPHRPSCLHLGCQTHQTWCAPRHLEPPPASIGRLFNEPNSKLFAGNYGCNRRSHLAHGTPQDGAWNRMRGLCVAVAQVAKVKAGCVAHRSEETEVTSSVSVRVRKEFTADGKHGSRRMIRLIAVAGFLAFATSAQAMSPAPLPQPDGMITQVRLGCGPFRTRVNGVCVARTTIRHTRRMVRRGYRRGYY